MKAAVVRFLSVLLLLCLFFALNAGAETPEAPSTDAARCFAVYNIENDRFILPKNTDARISPGSTVKIMSGLIICELLSGREHETVTLTTEMLAGVSGKPLGLSAGQSLEIIALMTAAFSGGYNDAVNALAVIAAGSVSALVEKMNCRAALLGMTATNYTNVSGLDSAGQMTTLSDTVKAAAAAADCGLFLSVSSEYTSTIGFSDGTYKLSYGSNETVSKNSQYYCRSARGMNSGMTDAGGACIVTLGEYDGARYIVAAMGCAADSSRFALVQDSLDYVYKNYGYRTVKTAGTVVGEAEVGQAASEIAKVKLVLTDDLRIYGAKNEPLDGLVFSLVNGMGTMTAPVSSGDTVARYVVWRDREVLATAGVTVDREVERSAFLAFLKAVKSYLIGRAFTATVIFAVMFSLAAVIVPKIALAVRQKRRRYVRHRGGFKLK